MLTIYTSFRKFEGEFKHIQHNAINSWLQLKPKPQIIVFNEMGNEYIKELCNNFGLINIDTNSFPSMRETILTSDKISNNDNMLLIAGDIILTQKTYDVLLAVRSKFKDFCICSKRIDIDVNNEAVPFHQKNWESKLKRTVGVYGDTWNAGDMFLHSKGFFNSCPNFHFGKTSIDNWLFKFACHKNALIDATECFPVYHQEHGRSWKTISELENDPLVIHNRRLYDQVSNLPIKWGNFHYIGINHANYIMDKNMNIFESHSFDR